MLPKVLCIVGPTASGKTDLAINISTALSKHKSAWRGAEIVSADSRQVYKHLNIGSGKVTKREMAGIPHHMLDIASPRSQLSVVRYQVLAYKAIDSIIAKGKLPIIVGGTGHYIDAITKGLIIPEVPPNARLRKKLERLNTESLFQLLANLDSSRSRVIDKHNPRRLVRAIEIATALGKVPKFKSKPRYSPVVIGISVPTKDLRLKIHERLVKRMRGGLVREVRDLHIKNRVSWKRLEQLGLEYKYIALYLQAKLTKEEMLKQLETAINQYAKRQMTWFKTNKDIEWLSWKEVRKLPRLASLPGLRGKVKSPFRLS